MPRGSCIAEVLRLKYARRSEDLVPLRSGASRVWQGVRKGDDLVSEGIKVDARKWAENFLLD